MNLLQTLLQREPAWFFALLWMSLQATVLAAVVFIVLKLVGRWIPPTWRVLLWFVVILRALIPFSPPSPFSLENLYVRRPAVIQAAPVARTQTAIIHVPNIAVSEPMPALPVVVNPPPSTIRILTPIWIAGLGISLAALAVRYVIIRRHLAKKREHIAERVVGGLADCRTAMGTIYPIRVSVSDQIGAPALTGLFPARLIVPSRFAKPDFTDQQMRHVLMHELAHLRLGHLFLHWLALITRALHWFNPAIHFAATRLREECEFAADAAALKGATHNERLAYAETILKVLSQTVAPSSQLALGMAEQARHVEKRLRAVTAPSRRAFGYLGALLLAALTAVGLSGADNSPSPGAQPSQPSINSSNATVRIQNTPDKVESGLSSEKVQKARSLIELGRLKEAEDILKQAAKDDPENRAVFYYLNLIKEQTWNESPRRSSNPTFGNPFATTNTLTPSTPRQALHRKLDSIRIDDFPLEKEKDLVDVLKELGSEIRKRLGDGKGVNLLIAQATDRPVQLQGKDAIDALTGLPRAVATEPDVDVEKFQIKFDPPIRDLTLRKFLDAIVAVAKPPPGDTSNARLKYSVEDYAVVFSQRTVESQPLYTRTYKIDASNASFPNGLRAFLSKTAGVDFPTNTVGNPVDVAAKGPSTKAMFYKDTAGILFVRATLADLDKIEQAIHHLNLQPAHISFEVTLVEITGGVPFDPKDALPATPRAIMMTNEYLYPLPLNSAGNQPLVSGAVEKGKSLEVPVRTSVHTFRAFEYFAENTKAKRFKETLLNKPGVNLMSAPTITTLITRPARISVEETRFVVTDRTVVKDGKIISGAANVSTGPSISVYPESANSDEIKTKVTYTFTEFLGPTRNVIQVRETTSNIQIPQNHTQIIIIPPQPGTGLEQDPRQYIIFLTPTIIDSHGMPVFK